jgi:UDP-N-acetylglucosamine 2-epimerase (non-hydrolysing)
VELVEAGWNTLVGADAAAIERSLRDPKVAAGRPALYGNGDAGRIILDTLLQNDREKA